MQQRPRTTAAKEPAIAVAKRVQWTSDFAAAIRHDFPPLDTIRSDSVTSLNWAERKLLRITDKQCDNYVNSLIECRYRGLF